MRRTRRRYLPAPEALESRMSLSTIAIQPPPLSIAPCDSGDDPPVATDPIPVTGPGGPGTSS